MHWPRADIVLVVGDRESANSIASEMRQTKENLPARKLCGDDREVG